MGQMRWIFLSAFVIATVNAAPRELNSDELITEPRPGEEYVNIQTGGPTPAPEKVDLREKSFTTSHRIPQYNKNKKSENFQTSHKIPTDSVRNSKSIKLRNVEKPLEAIHSDAFETAESNPEPYFEEIEATTTDVPIEVVTKTSVKMSKSKKVQKSVVKPQDVKIDIKASEGVIDETKNADEEEKEILTKKFSKKDSPKSEEKKFPKLNVPFEDEYSEEVTDNTKAAFSATTQEPVTTSQPKTTTTEEPPITTFNYKNVYDKPRKSQEKKEVNQLFPGKEIALEEKYKYEVVANESLKTAESRTQNTKKDTKEEKKEKYPKKDEAVRKEDTAFEVVPVNKEGKKLKEDNFDFIDAEEKGLLPAGSSPGQSSRINIKKGPNGQDYEYEYVYYYYDDDDDLANGTANLKEGKVVPTTTERVYNGHDGPAAEDIKEQNSIQSSTNGNKYLPTEATKTTTKSRGRPKDEYIEVTDEDEEDLPTPSRGGNSNNRYTSTNRHPEPVSNEVLPATTKPTTRSRGRLTNIPGAHPVPVEDIPPIGDERLPANTRFPPRSRSNNVAATSPQPQETTSRTRSRENGSQNRVRLPNLGLLDSSSFRTQPSDASIEDDPVRETELQRRPPSRTQTTETTEARRDDVPRRGTRPTTTTSTTSLPKYTETSEEVTNARRPSSRKPTEERTRPQAYEVEEPEEEERVTKITGNGRRPETTRESDAEEGDFQITKTQYTSIQRTSTEPKPVETTTEDQSTIGLTGAVMEKVALDLYAIYQQAQNENVRNNFVDANSTHATTDIEDLVTELSTTSTTTTTTTEAPTTTTTTTTTPATAQTGRGRYRTRGGNGAITSKSRTKLGSSSSATTTEAAPEATSPKTRGRFHPTHSNRVTNLSSTRRGQKPKTEEVQEDAAVKEEATKQNAEKTFGERPSRTRYRAGAARPTATSTTTVVPPSGSANVVATRANTLDRYNSRKRGGSRASSSTTAQPSAEEVSEEEKQEVQSEATRTAEEVPATPVKQTRPRVPAPGARPLRPGPRVPLTLSQRGRLSTTTTTQATVEFEEAEKDVSGVEQSAPQVEEVQDSSTTTPAPESALTRLKNRPRIRVGSNPVHKPTTTAAPVVNRKKLVSSLLPKRKPVEEKAVEKADEAEEEDKTQEKIQEETVSEENLSSSPEPSSTTAEPEHRGLSGLIAGRRRNLPRRPGTLYSRTQAPEAS